MAPAESSDTTTYGNDQAASRCRDWYLALRRIHEPKCIKLVIVAESPPASGKYFYDSDGSVTEPLFKALMQCLCLDPSTKESGLRGFQQAGWMLVDATYEPVNALDASARNDVILRDYELLRDDLAALLPDKRVPIILIKANVCRLLDPRLTRDGFSVLNRGQPVYFPSHGRQNEFKLQFNTLAADYAMTIANGRSSPLVEKQG